VVALSERSVSVGKVALAGLKVTAWLDADGTVNLQRLLAPAAPVAAASPPATAGNPGAAPPPWSAQ
jgi:hypothetical protein